MADRMVSFLIPAYNEAESIPELYESIMRNVQKCIDKGLMTKYELLVINDGSTDATEDVLRRYAEMDPNMHYISFRKNFGKSTALETGFRNVEGDVIITMDADLQDDPDELENFLNKLDEGYDLVSGWKYNRQDPAEKRLPSKFFNIITSRASGLDLHDFDCGYKAYRREVIDALHVYSSMHRYLPVMAWRSGFRIGEMPVHHNKRKYGASKYGIERYMQGLFDFMTVYFLSHYADRPMYFFGRLGLISGSAGVIICLIMLIEKIAGANIGTRPLLTLGITLITLGVQLFCTGFLGNMIVDMSMRFSYSEHRIRSKHLNRKDDRE